MKFETSKAHSCNSRRSVKLMCGLLILLYWGVLKKFALLQYLGIRCVPKPVLGFVSCIGVFGLSWKCRRGKWAGDELGSVGWLVPAGSQVIAALQRAPLPNCLTVVIASEGSSAFIKEGSPVTRSRLSHRT